MKDDLGQKFRLINENKLLKIDPDDSLGYHTIVATINHGVMRPARIMSKVLVIFLGLSAFLGTLIFDSDSLEIAAEYYIFALLSLLVVETVYRRVVYYYYYYCSTAIVYTLVSKGVCPKCAYHIGGLPSRSDGCIACPECGIAWYAYRITKPFTGKLNETKRQILLWLISIGCKPSIPSGHKAMLDHAGRFVLVLKKKCFIHRDNWQKQFNVDNHGKLLTFIHDTHVTKIMMRVIFIILYFGALALKCWYSHLSHEIFAFFALLGLVFAFMIFDNSGPIIKSCINTNICPGCACDLIDQPLHESGYTVCPQCHAAWDLNKYHNSK